MNVDGKRRKLKTESWSISIVKKKGLVIKKKSQHKRLRKNKKFSRRKPPKMWCPDIKESISWRRKCSTLLNFEDTSSSTMMRE